MSFARQQRSVGANNMAPATAGKQSSFTGRLDPFGMPMPPPETGRASREDGMNYGYCLCRGKRPAMEDYHDAQFSKERIDGNPVAFFAIFDGHGGQSAGEFVSKNLFKNLMAHPKFSQGVDVKPSIEEVFVNTDMSFMRSDPGQGRDDGSTASTLIVMGRKLIACNVGDSRVVLGRGGRAVPLTNDHKPNRADERQRIEAAGGMVVWAGTWRVGGVLAVSRAFGDRLLKRYVTAVPEIMTEELGPMDDLAILATDGLWDVLTNEEAVKIASGHKDAQEAAKALVDEAMKRGTMDNTSAIVVHFPK